jgi:predicted porin
VSAASAQSTVSLYGIVDGGYTYNGTDTNFTSGVTSTPRIGFKGTEDLGGGLQAFFVVETALNSGKEAATSIGDRGAFVGLSGAFGSVSMGSSVLTPSFYATVATNAIGTDNYGLYKYAGASRLDKSVNYTSPKLLGGLTLRGAMVQKADNGTTAATDIAAIYANGPLTLTASSSDNGFDSGTYVGAAYDLGVAKVFLSRAETAGTAAVAAVAFNDTAGKTTVLGVKATAAVASETYTNVGVRYPVNAALTLAAEYSQAKTTDINTYMLSAQYGLSKRTTLTAYTKKAEQSDAGFGFGVRHSF